MNISQDLLGSDFDFKFLKLNQNKTPLKCKSDRKIFRNQLGDSSRGKLCPPPLSHPKVSIKTKPESNGSKY